MRKVLLIALSFFGLSGYAQLSLDNSGVAVTIDFENTVSAVNEGTFNGSGLDALPTVGQLNSNAWVIEGLSDGNTMIGGTYNSGDFARGVTPGGVFSGGVYAFDITGDTAMGVQPTGSDFTPGSITLRSVNNTGLTIDSVRFSYTLYINNDADRGNTFNPSYSIDNVAYTNLSSLNDTSIELGSATVNWVAIQKDTTFPVSIADGDTLYLRWSSDDQVGGGSRDEFAIDDISITPYASPASTIYTLQLLHASDLEGGVEAIERAKFFAAIVDTLEEEYANSITLSAGDNYIPGPFFNAAGDPAVFRNGGVFNNVYNRHFGITGYNGLREGGGRADVTIMNLIGFDASAVGNHEFDAGPDAMAGIIQNDFRTPNGPDADRWVGAQFPYLSANLDFSNDGSLGGLYTSSIMENIMFESGPAESTAGNNSISKIAAATFIQRGGQRIGVVGVTTPLVESISSTGDVVVKGPGAGTNDLMALSTEIQPWIDSLINQGINKVILVTHLQQIQLEEQLAGMLNGVDIIVAGGSDAILANPGDRLLPGSTPYKAYPILTPNGDGDTCAIVSTDGEYSYVGRLVADFDSAGVLIPSSIRPESGPYLADSMMVASTWGNFNNAFADPNGKGALVDSITTAVTGVVIAKDGNIVGKSEVYLNGQRASVRTEETNLGNLTADANLWQALQYDPNVKVSIKNGGGIRAAIGEVREVSPGVYEFLPPQANPISGKQKEEVSQLDIENSLRFNNGLTVLDLSAAGLVDVLEHGVAAWAPNATPGQMCQVGGVEFSFDPALPAGSRIRSMIIVDTLGNPTDTIVREGALVGDTARTIKVVTLDFLSGGGDNYPYPARGSNFVDLDTVSAIGAGNATFAPIGSEQDALAEYMLNRYTVNAFDGEDEPVEKDERIQILSRRADGLFGVEVAFKEGRIVVDETAGTADVVIYYTNNTSSDQTITWAPLSISTTDGSDLSLSAASGIATANTSDSIVVTATIVNDANVENDEIAFVEIPSSLDYYFDDEEDQAFVLFIQDDDNVGPTATNAIDVQVLTSYAGLVNAGSTEILDYEPVSQRLFVTNSSNDRFEILDFSDPLNISRIDSIDISSFGGINSLNVYSGGTQPVIAAAIEGPNTADNGFVVFFDTNGVQLASVTVGVLPDMVTFTPDGQKVVVACEGEPNDDYTIDPEGSVAIIDVSGGFSTLSQANVTVLGFTAYNGQEASLRAQGIRIFGPGASAAQDLEPEYVAISPDNSTAYVACQEANAVAVVDLLNDTITALIPLGWKDHSLPGNGLDSDRDSDDITIAQAPFRGFYMPDAIATYEVNGQVYILSANEGDSRDYDGYSEEERLDDLEYDTDSIPNPELLLRAYGDIKVTTANGDIDNDGKYEHIYTYGARSFSVWNGTTGALVYDSGDDFEQIIKNSAEYSPLFNVSDDDIEIKDRSDDKGPEPEAVVVGEVDGTPYAFIGMERTGGIMVYNVSNPNAPEFVTVNIPRDTATGGGDQAPEGLIFIPAASSPTNENLVVAANEASNTITIWSVNDTVTSIQEFGAEKAGLVLYPNPAQNEVFIAAKNGRMDMIEVFDMNGRIVHSQNANQELHRLNVDRLGRGLYIVKVHTDKGIETLKMQLQ
jgi:2',3'-cyclic-nucleotide 2'-phosphodiesterase (5'-nucleotidase family)